MTRRRPAVLACIAAIALLGAACGSDTAEDASSSADVPATTPTTEAEAPDESAPIEIAGSGRCVTTSLERNETSETLTQVCATDFEDDRLDRFFVQEVTVGADGRLATLADTGSVAEGTCTPVGECTYSFVLAQRVEPGDLAVCGVGESAYDSSVGMSFSTSTLTIGCEPELVPGAAGLVDLSESDLAMACAVTDPELAAAVAASDVSVQCDSLAEQQSGSASDAAPIEVDGSGRCLTTLLEPGEEGATLRQVCIADFVDDRFDSVLVGETQITTTGFSGVSSSGAVTEGVCPPEGACTFDLVEPSHPDFGDATICGVGESINDPELGSATVTYVLTIGCETDLVPVEPGLVDYTPADLAVVCASGDTEIIDALIGAGVPISCDA